jgi:hypothetical protein
VAAQAKKEGACLAAVLMSCSRCSWCRCRDGGCAKRPATTQAAAPAPTGAPPHPGTMAATQPSTGGGAGPHRPVLRPASPRARRCHDRAARAERVSRRSRT